MPQRQADHFGLARRVRAGKATKGFDISESGGYMVSAAVVRSFNYDYDHYEYWCHHCHG